MDKHVKDIETNTSLQTKDSSVCWLACFLLVLTLLVAFGCSITFGILFPEVLVEFQAGKALTAFPGALAVANSGALGPIAGYMCDRWGSRVVMLAGCMTCAVGLLSSAFVPHIALLYLTYGMVNGFGLCMCYFSAQLIVPLYFERRRLLATSLVTIGPGAGLLVLSPIVQTLSEVLSWQKVMMCLAAMVMVPFFPAWFYRCDRISRRKRRNEGSAAEGNLCAIFDFSVLKDPKFAFCTAMTAITCLGHLMTITHLAKHCEEIGIGSRRSSWLYLTVGLCSTFSRGLAGNLSQSRLLSLPRIYQIGAFILASGSLWLPSATQYTFIVLFAVNYGIGEGLMLTPMYCLMLESLPEETRGRAYGVFQCIISLTYAVGAPLSGLIADLSSAGYSASFYTAGSLELVGACMPFLLRFLPPSRDREEMGVPPTKSKSPLVIVEKETVL